MQVLYGVEDTFLHFQGHSIIRISHGSILSHDKQYYILGILILINSEIYCG